MYLVYRYLLIESVFNFPFLQDVSAVCRRYAAQLISLLQISIAPANVGANTYSTALVIGEKAAVIIAEDLGIEGVA